MDITLGQFIRKRREEIDLSLRELAKKVDCSAAFLSDIELGRRFPSEQVLKAIAKVLDVSTETLKEYDRRAPVEDIKRLAETHPQYGLALRSLVDKKISPEELIKFFEKASARKGKK